MYKVFLIYYTTQKMKKLFSLFSMLILLISNIIPTFTYADEVDNSDIIELFSNLLNTYWEDNSCEVWIEYTSWDYKWVTTENCWIKITEYNGTSTDIIIPEEMNWYQTKEIWESVFYYKGITSATIPNTVEVIWERAFEWNNFNYNPVNLPEQLKEINDYARDNFFEMPFPKIEIECKIPPKGLNCTLAKSLEVIVLPTLPTLSTEYIVIGELTVDSYLLVYEEPLYATPLIYILFVPDVILIVDLRDCTICKKTGKGRKNTFLCLKLNLYCLKNLIFSLFPILPPSCSLFLPLCLSVLVWFLLFVRRQW